MMNASIQVPLTGYRIAIVEDDPVQAEHLARWTADAGALSDIFSTGNALLDCDSLDGYDILLLDWMLTDVPGDVVLDRIRRERNYTGGVIFITGLNSESDISFALSAGADDYVVKPARRRELLARIEAVHRRHGGTSAQGTVVNCAPYEFDLAARRIHLHGVECAVTAREFDLALFMFRHVDTVVRRQNLLTAVWGFKNTAETRTVDMHVSRLRKSLNLHPENGFRVVPVHSMGYRLERVSDSSAKSRDLCMETEAA